MAVNITKITLLLLPIPLTISCVFVFQLITKQLGVKWGYFSGFLFYWIFWCFLIPVSVLSSQKLVNFFKPSFIFDYKIVLCLVTLLIFVYAYAFPAAYKKANALIIFLSFVLALVNATFEEVLWRNAYLQIFSNSWISIGYASVGFAIWHYAPQAVLANKNPGGAHSFVAFAFVLGLAFSYVAYRQQSIFWTTITHIFIDFAGLGAAFYFK